MPAETGPQVGETVYYHLANGYAAIAVVIATADSLGASAPAAIPALSDPERVHLFVFSPVQLGGILGPGVRHSVARGPGLGQWDWDA